MGSWRRATVVTALTATLVVGSAAAPGAVGAPPEAVSSQAAAAGRAAPGAALVAGERAGAAAKPKGRKTDWKYGFPNKARWNPCKPIRWAYNPKGGYRKALKHTKKAVRRIKRQTGLPLVYAGRTSFSRGPFDLNPAGLDIVVRWASPKKVGELGGASGYGGGMAGAVSAESGWEAYNGFVILNRTQKQKLRKGFAKRGHPTWGQVITHEFLHALGLAHARGRGQLMYPFTHSGNHQFGKGDLQGMKKIGAGQGCVDAGVR